MTMINFFDGQQAFCNGLSRRLFLKVGALGAGLTLADMLRWRAARADAGPMRDKAVIMICLQGGPSHIDMYDPKPDAPVEFRGEFRAIQTSVPGVQICEHMPLQARMWDKLAIIRSIANSAKFHSDEEITTGYSEEERKSVPSPSLGAIVSKLRRDRHPDMPQYVTLRPRGQHGPGLEPGYLGVGHGPFHPDDRNVSRNLSPARGVSRQRLEDRRSLLDAFDSLRRDLDAKGSMTGIDEFQARAFNMLATGKVQQALDLNQEPTGVRQRYEGVEQALLARRLVEAGVGFVTLGLGRDVPFPNTAFTWDTHDNGFQSLKILLPQLDRAVAALVQDLHDRGMTQDVALIVWGEFGRAPRVTRNGGREHWPAVNSALLAGGGLKMGQVIGSTTGRGEQVKDRPYSVQNVLSTIYQVLGIDPAQSFLDNGGRPRSLLDERETVTELL
jgi:uncharacterized protein (DUF1501 family)